MSTRIDWYNEAAKRFHGMPDGWLWCRLSADAPEGFLLLEGAVPSGFISRGPRKGKPKWPKERQTLWIRNTELDEVELAYSRETGNCSKCQGTGQQLFKWSRSVGTEYIKCKKCKGTGKW